MAGKASGEGKRGKKGSGSRKVSAASEDEDILADCRDCERWEKVKGRLRVAELLAKSVESVRKRIANGEFKPTVAEYLKLVQMEQELEHQEANADGPREIRVTWVEPPAESNSEA